jgi:hypothetical protein
MRTGAARSIEDQSLVVYDTPFGAISHNAASKWMYSNKFQAKILGPNWFSQIDAAKRFSSSP